MRNPMIRCFDPIVLGALCGLLIGTGLGCGRDEILPLGEGEGSEGEGEGTEGEGEGTEGEGEGTEGEGEGTEGEGEGQAECMPGAVVECVCASGDRGARSCDVAGRWGDCECTVCRPGQEQVCGCPDNTPGRQQCTAAGQWGECVCGGCRPGAQQECRCEGGLPGVRQCTAAGEWSECVCAWDCFPNQQQECRCADGSAGTQICRRNGQWGDCQCEGPECQAGQSQQCQCEDGQIGAQTCTAAGQWGDCQCEGPVCRAGQSQRCRCADGQAGVQTCTAAGQWGDCQCEGPECRAGQSQQCRCADGQVGTQECTAAGSWSECTCEVSFCWPGQVQACGCENGAMGEQVCGADFQWGACRCDVQPCRPGETLTCLCPDGSLGEQTCDLNGQWGACGCEPQPCQPGQVEACLCADGSFSTRTCGRDGEWGSCGCEVQPCQPGQVEVCLCDDGRQGFQTCDRNGQWGNCVCEAQPCVPGQQQGCRCEDGSPGSQTCGADGEWGACVCQVLPCLPGQTEACACDDGALGLRTCGRDGRWQDCVCEAPICRPGTQQQCPCPDGSLGTQTCGNNGLWGECACAVAPPANDLCAAAQVIRAQGVQVVRGTTLGAANEYNEERGPDVYYRFELARPMSLQLDMTSEPIWDTFLYLFTGTCQQPRELAFNDDFPEPGTGHAQIVIATLPAGNYYIVATGYEAGNAGPFTLTATFGEAVQPTCGDRFCDPVSENRQNCPQDCVNVCGDGLCEGNERWNCWQDCQSGQYCGDNECEGAEDEANCPRDCALPANDTCETATVLNLVDGVQTVTGFTQRGAADLSFDCENNGADGPDVFYRFTLAAERIVSLHLTGENRWNTMLFLLSACGADAPILACSNENPARGQSHIDARLAAGTYWILVTGDDEDDAGAFSLAVALTNPDPGGCADPEDAAQDEAGIPVGQGGQFQGRICLQDNAWDKYFAQLPNRTGVRVTVAGDAARQDALRLSVYRTSDMAGEPLYSGESLQLFNRDAEPDDLYFKLENIGLGPLGRTQNISYTLNFQFWRQ